MAGTWVDIEIKNIGAIRRAFLNATGRFKEVQDETSEKMGEQALKLLQKTAQGVVFSFSRNYSGGASILTVGTDDEKYTLLNSGAGSHYIFPVKQKALAYPAFFRPKTEVGKFTYDSSGGKFGDLILRQFVWHPGFTGRQFDRAVKEELDGQPAMRTAIDSLVSGLRRFGLRI